MLYANSRLFLRAATLLSLAAATHTLDAQRLNPGMGPLLEKAQVGVGDRVPADLPIYTSSGEERRLAEIAKGKYTVLVSGCLTCPIFHRSYSGIEAVYRDYGDRGSVQFYFMYKSLAHPELNGYVQALTLEERLAHIKEAKRVLGTSIDWLSDGMDNRVRHALGFGPNTHIVIDPDGRIVHALGWSDAEVLRERLAEYVGESDRITQVDDLKLMRQAPYRRQRAYTGGALQKPVFDSELVAVPVEPLGDTGIPLYVKPRVEVSADVLKSGKGDLYLGFFLDPIHEVHWNNLAAPLRYEITFDDGSSIQPASASAPEVAAESDSDPREFALKVYELGKGRQARLSIHYFACSDKEGWCLPVTQSYMVSFEIDPDGGGTNGRSFRAGGGGGRRSPAGGRSANRPPQGSRTPSAEEIRERIVNLDTNGDGRLSKDEAPDGMRQRFAEMDIDGDGALDQSEIERMLELRFPRGESVGGQPQASGSQSIKERIFEADTNGDGLISREELPPQMRRRFPRMDANGDGFADEAEIDDMLRNRPTQRRQGPSSPNPGSI